MAWLNFTGSYMLGAKHGGRVLTVFLYRDQTRKSLLASINSDQSTDETIALANASLVNDYHNAEAYQIENAEGDVLAVGMRSHA